MADLDGSYNAARRGDKRGGPARLAISDEVRAALDASPCRWELVQAELAPWLSFVVEHLAAPDSFVPSRHGRWTRELLVLRLAERWVDATSGDEPPPAWVARVPELRSVVRALNAVRRAQASGRPAAWRSGLAAYRALRASGLRAPVARKRMGLARSTLKKWRAAEAAATSRRAR